jgi:biopolymer transport protein ExbB/TolQ
LSIFNFSIRPFFAQQPGFDFTPITDFAGVMDYIALLLVALWGAYCCIILWRRIAQLRFADEDEQDAFLDEVQNLHSRGAETELTELCEDDPRGVPMLVLLAMKKRHLPLAKLRTLLIERFQRDIVADLDYRVTWVGTIIKAAPMIGLFGTVVGMMGAFGKLSTATEVSPDKLAGDIMFALITTAMGLTIAIPLVLAMASLSNRIGQLEDLVGAGLTRIIDIFGKK